MFGRARLLSVILINVVLQNMNIYMASSIIRDSYKCNYYAEFFVKSKICLILSIQKIVKKNGLAGEKCYNYYVRLSPDILMYLQKR